jgi:hypothetical protein
VNAHQHLVVLDARLVDFSKLEHVGRAVALANDRFHGCEQRFIRLQIEAFASTRKGRDALQKGGNLLLEEASVEDESEAGSGPER